MSHHTSLQTLIAIIVKLGTQHTESRISSTYALDVVRGQSKSNLSRSDASQMLRVATSSEDQLKESKLLLTICYLFNDIKTNEKLSTTIQFVNEVSEAFDLKALNCGKEFSFDEPTPAILTAINAIASERVFLELASSAGVELDEESESYFERLDDTAAITSVLGSEVNLYSSTEHMEHPDEIYSEAEDFSSDLKIASLTLHEVAEHTGKSIKDLAKLVSIEDLVKTFEAKIAADTNYLSSLKDFDTQRFNECFY